MASEPGASLPLQRWRAEFLGASRRLEMRQSGTVKFYNEQKGYGFITPDDGGKDVFVHVTALEQSGINNLSEGSRISFDTEPDKRGKGPKAINLQPAS
jgi:CspA family cold shock protein